MSYIDQKIKALTIPTTSWIIKMFYSNYIWKIPNNENKVYLTFDDGPTPEITQWVLDLLKKHKAKATFFCIGDNINKYPAIFEKIIQDRHSIGNHTFNHLNGWKTSKTDYLKNVDLCDLAINSVTHHGKNASNIPLKTRLFRPPYGKIKRSQANVVRKLGYKIIMWDCISEDYDAMIIPEKCLENVLLHVTSGSIIVFHDSKKAFKNLEYALPRTLAYLNKKGFVCEALQ